MSRNDPTSFAATQNETEMDNNCQDAYQYQPLATNRSIRLIRLLPSTIPSSTIECQLYEVSLDSKPAYEALSYVWGKSGLRYRIKCGMKEIAITYNCEAALRHLRRKRRVKVLWVDSICIDQSSVQEKNVQVPLMGEIYGSASCVLSWLGQGTDMASVAFKHMARICVASRMRIGERLLVPALLARLNRCSGMYCQQVLALFLYYSS